ncbi:MAG: hypothetical protein NC247_03745 [Ruminococcus flavefaciens]|nr:hypothetical protein [Ruminococcus flavefaciens]MCM1361188.1 hypothetical protein [Clostridiales bacterium]MCM1434625.1 hypothetical protein [Ruminococcus flavefaciens]
MKKLTSAALILALLLTVGCGKSGESSESAATATTAENTVAVAGENETVPDELVIPDDMTPVTGSQIKDGTYDIKVDSSSSMFKITSCSLTVENGEMTAVMTMSGQGYLYVFMGKGEDASDESKYIPFVENENGEHTFTVPVEALDKAIDCSAFSKKKEQWYDRTLLFNASSLPADAFKDGEITSVESLGLTDGTYMIDVTLEGGSGKATVQSPAEMIVENGSASAVIIWNSPNYDYMIVDGNKFEFSGDGENATFTIPVIGFDYKMPVTADTTAMSKPHEIEYTLFFDSSTIKSNEN